MHAYLFVGGETKDREKEMLVLATKHGKIFEFPLGKISDVRELSDFTKYSQDKAISVVIKNIDNATKEALNAFLKNLEEPQKNISYYLSAQSETKLLSTITSRCQIVRLGKTSQKKSNTSPPFLKMSFGEKIKEFENYKKKEEAKAYLKKLVLDAHDQIIKGEINSQKLSDLMRYAIDAMHNLDRNANVSLQMTNLTIKVEKIRFTN